MRALRLALAFVAGLAIGLAAMRAWYRLDAGPRSAVVIRFGLDGTPRVYGPATRARAELAGRAVGGRVAECVPLP